MVYSAMSIGAGHTFQLVGGHPATDFINTLDWRFRESGAEELLKRFTDLVRFMMQSKLISPVRGRRLANTVDDRSAERTLQTARMLRESLADFLYARLDGRQPSSHCISRLQEYFQDARAHQKLVWKKGRVEWTWNEEDKANLPVHMLSSRASDLIMSTDLADIRACCNPECRWIFVDVSKNRTRRWCSMKICGNRMKARRFYAQKKLATS
jgi:predicted RNA-binding Zn ribbon-like protein